MKNLSQKLVKLLSKKKLKISFAESCTGGLLSSSITSVSEIDGRKIEDKSKHKITEKLQSLYLQLIKNG